MVWAWQRTYGGSWQFRDIRTDYGNADRLRLPDASSLATVARQRCLEERQTQSDPG